jgi:HEAT repeat protein
MSETHDQAPPTPAPPQLSPAPKPADPLRRRRTALVVGLSLFGLAAAAALHLGEDRLRIRWAANRLQSPDDDRRRAAAEQLAALVWPDRPPGAPAGTPPPEGVRSSARYRAAVAELAGLLDHPDDDVFSAAFDLLSSWGEIDALPDAGRFRARRDRLNPPFEYPPATYEDPGASAEPPPDRPGGARSDPVRPPGESPWSARLADPSAEVRGAAAWTLLRDPAGRADRPLLRRLLADADPELVRLGIAAAAALGDADAAGELLLLLEHAATPPAVRAEALLCLSGLDPQAGREAALRRLDGTDPPEVRAAAAYLLGRCRGVDDRAALLRSAADPAVPALVRAGCVAALIRRRSAPLGAPLRTNALARELLTSPDRDAAAWAAWAMVAGKAPDARRRLMEFVELAERQEPNRAGAEVVRLLAEAGKGDRSVSERLARIAGAPYVADGETVRGRAKAVGVAALNALAALDRDRACRVASELIAALPDYRSPADPLLAEGAEGEELLAGRTAVWSAYLLARLTPPAAAHVRLRGVARPGSRAAAVEALAAAPIGGHRVAELVAAKCGAAESPESEAARMLLAPRLEPQTVAQRAREGKWDWPLAITVLLAKPATRRAAWDLLLTGPSATPEIVDLRFRRLGLDAELAADFPDAPAYEHYADPTARLFQCRVLLAWWAARDAAGGRP